MAECKNPKTCTCGGITLHCKTCGAERMLNLMHKESNRLVIKRMRQLGWSYSEKTKYAKCPKCTRTPKSPAPSAEVK